MGHVLQIFSRQLKRFTFQMIDHKIASNDRFSCQKCSDTVLHQFSNVKCVVHISLSALTHPQALAEEKNQNQTLKKNGAMARLN